MAFNNFNPYAFNQYQSSLQDMRNKLTMLENMQAQTQQLQPQPSMNGISNSRVIQRGEFVVVATLQDAENYSAPVDGTPCLIFLKDKNVFYSKKYDNGVVKCLPYIQSPYINGEPVDTPKQTVKSDEGVPQWAESLISKVNALENKINHKTQPQKKAQPEVTADGI